MEVVKFLVANGATDFDRALVHANALVYKSFFLKNVKTAMLNYMCVRMSQNF